VVTRLPNGRKRSPVRSSGPCLLVVNSLCVPRGRQERNRRQKREDTVLATFEIMMAILFGVLPLALLGGHGPTWATATA
jgi:hypothetical protein